ncbi:MAG TPA: hypothetical protein PLP04_04240 [Bryobacteraceae bacterium]|nr:hypothetical protein [Bryobacteraceae bacterium]HPQ14413.1 hypothetical protein [Bryobacteraceae bacterium]
MRALRFLAVLLGLVSVSALAAERWQLQYFHDEDDSTLAITGLEFADAERGIAVGAYIDRRGKAKPAGLVTTDGGRTWSPVRLPELPLSLFLLDERTVWLVTNGRLWVSTELGREWRSLARLRDVGRVYFLDEKRGFAVGARKSAYQTSDGGKTWTKLAAADEPNTTRDYTVYSAIAFAKPKQGMIVGWSKPPRKEPEPEVPDWLDPSARRRELPGMMIVLETRDGGATWSVSQSSMFGRVSCVRLRPDGVGLGLIEFLDAFDWPSEVIRIDWRTGKSTRAFRDQRRIVTDIAMPPGGPAYLAAIEPPGALARSPIPGKLKILRSENLVDWTEMPVDYRAVGTSAVLAAAQGRLWAGTSHGMILKLVSE